MLRTSCGLATIYGETGKCRLMDFWLNTFYIAARSTITIEATESRAEFLSSMIELTACIDNVACLNNSCRLSSSYRKKNAAGELRTCHVTD